MFLGRLYSRRLINIRTISKHVNDQLFDVLYIDKMVRSTNMSLVNRLKDISDLSNSLTSRQNNSSNMDIIHTINNLNKELSNKNVEMVVGGSISLMMMNTPPRFTKDIDINIRLCFSDDEIISKEELKTVLDSINGADLTKYKYIVPKSRSLVTPRIIIASFIYNSWPVDIFLFTEGNVRKRTFSSPIIVDGIKFAPPECLCFWKMMSYKSDLRYYKDRSDIVALLKSGTNIDEEWVREQLVIHDGESGERVREWDELLVSIKLIPFDE